MSSPTSMSVEPIIIIDSPKEIKGKVYDTLLVAKNEWGA